MANQEIENEILYWLEALKEAAFNEDIQRVLEIQELLQNLYLEG